MPDRPVVRVVKVLAAVADRIRPPARGVTILIYHRVGGRSGLAVDLPAPLFADQMAWLAETGRVVSLDTALGAIAGHRLGTADPVVVTFDDGTADFADVALPILVTCRIPATLYAATEFIDTGRAFPADGQPVSWPALRDACETGLVDVGSHTHTHALLDRLAPEAIDDELDRSCGLIEDHLGRPALDFAYPKALAPSPSAALAVRRRFRSAALAGTHANPYGATDPLRLARSPIQVRDGLRWFERKAAGGMALEDTLRGLINRGRYAGATT